MFGKKEKEAEVVQEKEQKEEKPAPEVGDMKKGDYMIHVYMQEGKAFKSSGDTSNPLIEVSCYNSKKYTSSKKDVSATSSVYWGEHIFFEFQNMSKHDIETSQISFRVLNKGFIKDDLIGAYDFDVSYVYFQKQHTMFHQWVAFSNPESQDFNEIRCYLKMSISIQGPGDEQVQLSDQAGLENTEQQEVMMPASIKKEFKQIKIRLIKGEKFPKMDTFGTIDAYFQGSFLRKKMKTKVVTQSKDGNCPIEQEIWLPIQWPMASDRFILKLFDEDKVSDEIVGSLYFSFKRIVNEIGPEGKYFWRNLYGSPLGVSGSATDLMNEAPEKASTWKGRCLMHMSVFDTKSPELKVVPLDPNFKQQLATTDVFQDHEFEIYAEVGSGICLPGKEKYTIKIQINDFTIQTDKPKEYKEGYCRWSERLPLTSFKAPYKTIDELARVYVYLMDGSSPVCFWQGFCKDFVDPDPKFKWVVLTADKAIGKVKKEFESGLIQLKLTINDKQQNPNINYQSMNAWKKPPPKRLSSYKIRCYIFQCKDIPSADSDGASDAYISLWNPDNDKNLKTCVIEDNVNPIFFQTLELHYDYQSLDDAPPVVLNLWDLDDAILDSDDFLGRAVVYLNEASICNDDSIPEPKWHDIRLSFDESMPPCGSMLLSFSTVEDDYAYKIPTEYLKLTEQIEYSNFVCEINILGLRNLESFGLMPVKKPFIRFNLRSLLPPEKAQAITNIKTQPNAFGPNPNINTMINFQVDLPVNPLFCPKLQCDVFDYVYKGLVQPLIGTFQLPIGDIMHEQRMERDKQINESEEIIKFLKIAIQDSQDKALFSPVEEKKQRALSKYDKLDAPEHDESEIQEKKRLLEGGPQTDEAVEEEKERLGDQFEEQKGLFEQVAEGGDLQGSIKALRRKKQQNLLKEGKTQVSRDLELALSMKLMQEQQVKKEEQKQRRLTQRLRDQQTIKEKYGDEAHRNIFIPKYNYDDRLKIKREVNKPPATLYMELGYNEEPPEKPEDDKKHYRKYYDDELENNKEIFPRQPFHTADIIRGQSRGLSKGMFSIFSKPKEDESGQVSDKKIVGLFKGMIHIENYDERDEFKMKKEQRIKIILQLLDDLHKNYFGQPLEFKMSDLESYEKQVKFQHLLEKMNCDDVDILGFLKEQSYNEMITRQMLIKTKALVRLYMVDGYDFAQKDIGSASDPYLTLECGSKSYNERDHYQLDEPNPKFFKLYEFDAEFPGASPLSIKAYDYDDLFGDDLIGETIIDLDDRFFSPEWQQIEDKLIESRQLYHPSTSNSQGVVRCWLEIHATSSSTKNQEKVWDITPMPPKDFEVRVVVWDTEEIKSMDVEDVSDVFVKCHIDDNDKRQTDCHYRAQEGKASFNYRLLFNTSAPRPKYMLTVQSWDRDLFKSNDFIGEAQIDLQPLFEDALVMKNQIVLDKKYYDTQVKSKNPGLKVKFYDEDSFYVDTVDKDGKFAGRIRLTVHVVPKEMAEKNAVGAGRAEPNHSPFCPPPVGRISFTMNPIEMFFQFVGPAMRRKVYMYCCLALCATICILIFPILFSDILSQTIISIF